jgi:flagellar L-ring protein FlgH
MKKNIFVFALLLLSACARSNDQVVKIPEPLEEGKDPIVAERTAGSLYSSANSSMFSDHKARNVGDILTVLISEAASASKEAKTSTGRTSNMSASIPNLFGLENTDAVVNSDPKVDLSNLVKADFSNSFEGNGSTSRKGVLTASLTTQVIGMYPNGNLKIRGGKEVTVNSEVQIIYLTGIVRPVDITAANTIPSTKILNARISYTGNGSISDTQQPGWLMRTLDNVWPF